MPKAQYWLDVPQQARPGSRRLGEAEKAAFRLVPASAALRKLAEPAAGR